MTVPACPAPGLLVERGIERIATQYREAPNLVGYMRAVLGLVEEAARTACAIPSFFDLDTAVGDQLTILGKRLGWPRCHCVCTAQPVYGVTCPGVASPVPIAGLCEDATFLACEEVGSGELCLHDDAVYRGYLKARRYQKLRLWDVASLQAAARHLWGPTAHVADGGTCRVVVAPGRALTARELMEVPLAFRVLPLAPGVKPLVHYGAGLIAGVGTGWGGLCDGSALMCPVDPRPYDCA